MPTNGQGNTTMDDDDFLDAVEADNANVTVKEPEPPEEPTVEPVAPPEPEPAPQEPVPPEPASPLEPPVLDIKPDPGFVPISVILDERDRRQKAEAELAQYRARQQQPPQAAPDVFEDPEGYAAHQDQQSRAHADVVNNRWSAKFAVQQHGAELVQTAAKWAADKCQIDPYFEQQAVASGDLFGFAVDQYNRDQIVSKVNPDDFAQFQAWKTAQAELQPQPNPHTSTQPSRAIPPRSLASAPSAGGVLSEVIQSDEEVFDDTFRK